mmetsp:Transcript_35857/g.90119  ORF Transcript_35857/g.90119 Transcript_35857/m.90119 type:complete len:344 (-) Transcript_35857:701-1732(-)
MVSRAAGGYGGTAIPQPRPISTHKSSSSSPVSCPLRTNSANASLGSISSSRYILLPQPLSMPCTEVGGNTMVSPALTSKRRPSQKATPEPDRMKKTSYAESCLCGGVSCPGWNTSMPNVNGCGDSPRGSNTSASRLVWLGNWKVSTSVSRRSRVRRTPRSAPTSRWVWSSNEAIAAWWRRRGGPSRRRSSAAGATSAGGAGNGQPPPPCAPLVEAPLVAPAWRCRDSVAAAAMSRPACAAVCAPSSRSAASAAPVAPQALPSIQHAAVSSTVGPASRAVASVSKMAAGKTTRSSTRSHRPSGPAALPVAAMSTGPWRLSLSPSTLSPADTACAPPTIPLPHIT